MSRPPKDDESNPGGPAPDQEQDVEQLSAELKRQVADAKARISERMSRTRSGEPAPKGTKSPGQKTPTSS